MATDFIPADPAMLPNPPKLVRQASAIEKELLKNESGALALATDNKTSHSVFQYDMQLKDCVFVGHTNTDLDSVAAAIGAAYLFKGTAARASEINTETEWVLKRWRFDVPPMFKDIPDYKSRDVCLVDFNQRSQLTEGIDEKKIKGIIDHHALRDGAVATDYPIYIDVRPWGSVATILSHTYFRNRVHMPRNYAGLLLSAILSDTLNLNSPTCTETDKLMVAALSKIAEVKDVDGLAQQQFRAKSKEFFRSTIPEILRGDLKRFKIRDIMLAFGVCETSDTPTVLLKQQEILDEMLAMKAEEKDSYVFFAVIDVVNLKSTLLVCGLPEQELAEKAFGVKMDSKTSTMDLGKRVSRKKTMVPPLDDLLKAGGFKLSAKAEAAQKTILSSEYRSKVGKLELVYDNNCVGEIRRRGSVTTEKGSVPNLQSLLRRLSINNFSPTDDCITDRRQSIPKTLWSETK